MKNIFAYKHDKTAAPEFNGRPFLTKEAGRQLIEQTIEFTTEKKEAEKKYTLPLPLIILQILLFVCGMIVLIVILNRVGDTSIAEAWENLTALFIIAPVCLIACGVFYFISYRLKKAAQTSDDMIRLTADAQSLEKKSKDELGVPSDAAEIDVIAHYYKEKNGKISPFGRANVLEERSVFIQNDAICFADIFTLVTVPLSAVKGVQYVKKSIVCVGGWNKEEQIKSPKYKKYATINGNGQLFVKGHYVVELNDVRGEYEILIPTYDFDEFSAATGYRVVCDTAAV